MNLNPELCFDLTLRQSITIHNLFQCLWIRKQWQRKLNEESFLAYSLLFKQNVLDEKNSPKNKRQKFNHCWFEIFDGSLDFKKARNMSFGEEMHWTIIQKLSKHIFDGIFLASKSVDLYICFRSTVWYNSILQSQMEGNLGRDKHQQQETFKV